MICVEDIDLHSVSPGLTPAGKRALSHDGGTSGRYVKALPFRTGERFSSLAIDASVRAALARRSGCRPLNAFSVDIQDLRRKRLVTPGRSLVIFAVDASDSMGQGTFVRMKAAKGAALALLAKAQLRRHRVGMVAFNAERARVALPPTRSLTRARRCLHTMPTGGATPLADGLMAAWKMIKSERIKSPQIRPLLVLISDGEANVPLAGFRSGGDVTEELRLICSRMACDRIETVLIDTQSRSGGDREMRKLADWLGGAYYHIDFLKAGHVMDVVAAAGG